jgi:GTP-binding protein Era
MSMEKKEATFRAGFIAIVGPPNAGKSTLLNRMLGMKISITSKKPQTTRNRILGVLHRPGVQLVFVDTPGVHDASRPLNVRIVDQAVAAIADCDLVMFMVDSSAHMPKAETLLLEKIKAVNTPVVLVLNKTDLVAKEAVLLQLDLWKNEHDFVDMIPISARKGTQVDRLIGEMEKLLPENPPFFPEDALTDVPERFLAAELIREKVFRLTGEEIPYASAVTIDSFAEEDRDKLVTIHATIHVERESQKGIIIGKQGAKLKEIGTAARKDLERMLDTKVFLKLFVRVQKNWSRDTKALDRFGY